MAISNAFLKAKYGKPTDHAQEINDGDGLLVAISKKGTITFKIRYSIKQKQKRTKIGTYPEMSLAAARAKAEELLIKAKAGKDPSFHIRREKQLDIDNITLPDVIDRWYEEYACNRSQDAKNVISSLLKRIPTYLAKSPINDIDLIGWKNAIRAIVANTRSPTTAHTLISELMAILNWGFRNELIVNLTYQKLRKSDYVTASAKTRLLSEMEVGRIWNALDEDIEGMNLRHKIIARLYFIFGCRLSELRLAKKSDFDFNKMVWTVPKENLKGRNTPKKRDLERAIPDRALEYIQELFAIHADSELLLPSRIGNNNLMLETSISKFCTPLCDHLDFSERFTFHDFRRAIKSHLGTNRVPDKITEHILAHIPPGITWTYDHSALTEQMREAYDLWIDLIEMWAAQERGDLPNVISIGA